MAKYIGTLKAVIIRFCIRPFIPRAVSYMWFMKLFMGITIYILGPMRCLCLKLIIKSIRMQSKNIGSKYLIHRKVNFI